MASTRDTITQLATQHGFFTVRVAPFVSPTPGSDVLRDWLAAGRDGDMAWMGAAKEVREDPSLRLPEVRSVLVLAFDYARDCPPDPGGLTGRVARYAWGRDYHNLVGKALKKVQAALRASGVNCWGGVDTAPILERSWARLSGLGYLGKNTMSIVPSRGSYYFLAVLFVDAQLEPDPPLNREYCGSCRRCLVACPTDAFPAPYALDARRCISYWTIEAQGLPPADLRPGFGRWFFGCDTCQEVCPHNGHTDLPTHPDLQPRNAWLDMPAIVATPDEHLMDRFIGTPLRRPKAVGLKRNALMVLGNLGDPAGIPVATTALAHPAPVVRAAAVWALHQLDPSKVPDRDPEPIVQAEIDAS
jgi:epoxyqueuosine reductase